MPFITLDNKARLFYRLEGNDEFPVLVLSHCLHFSLEAGFDVRRKMLGDAYHDAATAGTSEFTRDFTSVHLGPPADTDFGIDVSPDGRWLVYSRADSIQSDIMLVENFH